MKIVVRISSLNNRRPAIRRGRSNSTVRTILGSIGLAAAINVTQGSSQESIVLLHGLGRTSLSMKRLEWHFRGQGYRVINRTYPSHRKMIEPLADEWLESLLASKISTSDSKVHFVTHSLGGIVLRQYLCNHHLPNLGRVVMLAPPNQGSELADFLSRYGFFRWLIGPSFAQLGTAETCLPQQLKAVDFPLGVIAGDQSSNPIFSKFIPGLNDGKVAVERTRARGMSDFLVQHQSHTWLMWRQSTLDQISHFLIHGRFFPFTPDAR